MKGKRIEKYDFCSTNSISNIEWKELKDFDDGFLLKYVDNELKEDYDRFPILSELFPFQTSGVKTHGDQYYVSNSLNELSQSVSLKNEGHDFKVERVSPYSYRPFDNQQIYYDNTLLGRAREKTIYHFIRPNVGIWSVRQSQVIGSDIFDAVYVTNRLTDTNLFRRGGPVGSPLYLYPDTSQPELDGTGIRPNIDEKLAKQLAVAIGCDYVFDAARAWEHGKEGEVLPLDILDYTYAVLHSPAYREKYKEFLKIDFPRIPYCTDEERFRALVKLGAELRQAHLLEHPHIEQQRGSIGFPVQGNNVVEKPKAIPMEEAHAQEGILADYAEPHVRVYINGNQYFNEVPLRAWEFYIGGYQPAQKWLKDRQGRTLTFDDIVHYQKIIIALTLTAQWMQQVDAVGVVEAD